MKGRKPKPTALKDLHGSEEPRNPNEPMPEGDLSDVLGEVPEHFDAEQAEIWRYALKHSPPGLLKMVDRSALEIWVSAHSIHRKAMRAQNRYGMVIPAPNTKLPIQSPYLAIVNRQALICLKACELLGFTPASRPRINVGGMEAGASLNGHHASKGEESIDAYLDRAPSTTAVH